MNGIADSFDTVPFCDGMKASADGGTRHSPSLRKAWLRGRMELEKVMVASKTTGVLYNIPDERERSTQGSGGAEAKACPIGVPSSRCRALAARQPGQAVQEVRQDGMSLCRRHRPRPGLLPFRDARSGKDAIVLRSAAAQEPSVPVPAEPPQAAGTGQRNHRAQSGAPGARSARRRLIQNRGGALLPWISGAARRLARSTRARPLRGSVACWPRCCWTH